MRQLLAIAVCSVMIVGCSARPGAPSQSPAATETVIAVASSSAPSPTPAPTATPTMSPAPTATPLPTDEPELETPSPVDATERPAVPDFPEPPGMPVIAIDGGKRIEASLSGGCGGVLYLAEQIAWDDCVPPTFDEALQAEPTVVDPGVVIAMIAPTEWRIGSDPAAERPWFVRVAGTDGLKGESERYSGQFGPELSTGVAPRRVIRVDAPTRPGDYLLQLESGVSRDGFTITGGRWYWHIRVP